jgi:hypothetical protein
MLDEMSLLRRTDGGEVYFFVGQIGALLRVCEHHQRTAGAA